jgi:FKBP-type peptidyl-prolyl cis-trans isomerase 2
MNFNLSLRILLLVSVIFFCSSRAGLAAEKIKKGKHVTINYTLKVDGQVIQTTFGQQPFSFTVGEGVLLPSFEKQINGLKVKDKRTFSLTPKEGYGEVDPQLFREVPKINFQQGTSFQEGMVVQVPDNNGRPQQGIIWKVNENSIVINFNHPLAGKTITFDIEVLAVESPAKPSNP